MAKKASLGKGLNAIISSPTPADRMEKEIVDIKNKIFNIDIDKISPNPDQPRITFDEHELTGLAESIKSVGIISPIIVRKEGGKFFIVAGERRYRAVKSLGQKTIKATLIEADEEKNFSIALIENIQRDDLDPIEEAKAYEVLVNRFKLKQQDVAEKVGKDRATIGNSLRLLKLPEMIQISLSAKKISTGHAKVLLSISDKNNLIKYYNEIIEKGLSVRALENLLKGPEEKISNNDKEVSVKSAQFKKMEDKLISLLGTKVAIKGTGEKGRIEINYYSGDDLDRIIEIFK
jgi:ParB family transcriptional regulator, chromosome partitioning protein